MPTYRHQSMDSGGVVASGVLVAADRATAMRLLQAQGLLPMQLSATDTEVVQKPTTARRNAQGSTEATGTDPIAYVKGLFRTGTGRPSLKRTELANIIRELATAIEAGLPLLNALKTVRRQASGKSQPVILDFIIERVESGRPLHEAMEEYGPPFDDMIIGMVRASDASGRMSEVMHQLADLLDRSVELRRELVGATIYPLIVACMIGVSIIIAVTFLLPRLMAPIIGQPGVTLPFPTKVLLGFADFMYAWWWLVLILTVAGVIGFRRWVAAPKNRRKVDLMLLKAPIVGNLVRDIAVARFTRTLGTLVSAGLPILSALNIVRDTLGNTVLMDAIDGVQEKVTTGQSLAEPLEKCGFFPPLLVQIVNIGERSGRLEPMLLHAATAFDRQVNTSLKLFTKLLPPVLLVGMAMIAAFVLAAILLPLLEMQKALGG
ncbi:MAG: type II secretion system F family protein [Planctomycetota bacterium]|nr:MAG: type II secretion system F family protein [Planctomycetota bacterium]